MAYKILSPHYEGPSSVSHRAVDAKDIKSGHVNPPATIFAKDKVVRVTANTRFETSYKDFLKNGPVTQIDDYRFGRWIKRGNDNYPNRGWNKPIPKMPDFAVIQSPRLGMYFHSEHDTPVNLRTSHDIVNAFDPNRLGFAYSKIANLEQTLRSMNPGNEHYSEAAEWIGFLAKKGFSIDKSHHQGIIGLGVEEGDFLAAYYPAGYLVREANFRNKAKSLISRYGLADSEAVKAMQRSVLLHEFGHVAGIESEKLQGLLQAEFYSTMAERYKGTKWERIYKALAQEGIDYARESSISLLDLISGEGGEGDARLRAIERNFLKVAVALGVRDVGEYVNMRMEETLGSILRGEPSYKSNNKKSSNKQSLEEIASESDKLSIAVAEEGIVPAYEGRRVYGEGASMPEKFVGKGIIDKSEYKSMSDAEANINEGKNLKLEKAGKEAPQEDAETIASGE